MHTRSFVIPGLLLIAMAGLALAASPEPSRVASSAATGAPVTVGHKVVAYYFHGSMRCRTCRHIESATEDTLRARFGAELKAGRLEWQTANFDEPQTEHVIRDYGLVAQSVVLVDYRDGKEVRFKNLDKVWDVIHDDIAFEAYVRDEVLAFLKAAHD